MTDFLPTFQQRLIDSELLDPDLVNRYHSQLKSGRNTFTEKDFASALVKAGELTPYQARAIYQAKGKKLILGNYVILDKIGVGGMGRIYRAKHQRMDRIVALKVLPPEATDKEDAVQRFHQEVKAAARLLHPNIVMAFDADVANGLHFMVMEYVNGTDLSSLVKQQGRLSVQKSVDYILQTAHGLQYAHLQNVIHRDIKPGNLILDQFETVRVLDMGLARLNDAIHSNSSISVTKPNIIMGTIDYMSPEQALNSKGVDERGDIYSLGMTLYFLLTGKPAFGGESAVERLLAHRDAPIPSLSAQRSDVNPKLDSIFQKMVAKSPEERHQSMEEVIRELESYSVETIPTPQNLRLRSADNNLNAFLLSLETVPAFVPSGTADFSDTCDVFSNSDETKSRDKHLDYDPSSGGNHIAESSLLSNSRSEIAARTETKRFLSIFAVGTGMVACLVAVMFNLGETLDGEDQLSPPASSIVLEDVSEEISQDKSKEQDPISEILKNDPTSGSDKQLPLSTDDESSNGRERLRRVGRNSPPRLLRTDSRPSHPDNRSPDRL